MGQQNSKILTKSISPQQLVRKQPVEVGLYFYPFKQYLESQFNDESQEITLQLIKPYEDSVKISTTYYPQLEKAVYQKTFDFIVEDVFFDTFNFDKVFYKGYNHKVPITFVQRKFKQFQSQLYKNILYEKHIYEAIHYLQCPNLIKLNDSFCINSNLQKESPFTYFFVFQNLQVNLSQIIRYRRQNNCEWYVIQFQKLCWDLVSAVNQLHQTNITHNDIRPCNIFYSIEKQCYVLGEFSSALKTDPNGTFLNVKTRTHPSFIIPEKQLSTDVLKQVFINHKRADIYSLGITLLCAFYMTEPVERKLAAPINRKMQEKYEIIKILRKMVTKSENHIKITDLKQDLKNCNKNSNLTHLIRSIKFRHKPKTKQLPMMYLSYSSAYKRLGLWEQWRDSLQSAYQAASGNIAAIQEAKYFKQMSRVQKLLQNHNKADELGQKAANLYYEIGSKYSEQNNHTEAFSSFNKGMKALNYCINTNKIVFVKILQSLSILYFEENQHNQSLACLKQSKRVLNQTYSESLSDYYEIKSQQAKIYQIHLNFEAAQKVLNQLLQESIRQKNQIQRIEFLKKLGLNSIKRGEHPSVITKIISDEDQFISSPLRRSKVRKFVEGDNCAQNLTQKQWKQQNFEKAQQYFQQASKLIFQKIASILNNTTLIKRKTINKDYHQLEDFEIEFENVLVQKLLILKHLGQIKFKQIQIERAEDYFYKILAELDKIFNENEHISKQISPTQIKEPFKQIKVIQKSPFNLKKQHEGQVDSRKQDFDEETYSNLRLKMENKDASTKRQTIQTKILSKPKRLLNKGDLIKMKADVQCSIALCKQQQGQYQQMLSYYNKSLCSYKSYYGQFHNKLCGIIIGSMALGYQKVNQHSKALQCIGLATQILRDIEPQNSPDLRHFERVRRQVIKQQSMNQKQLFDRKNLQMAHNMLAEMLSSTLGLKRRERKRTTLKSKKSIYSNSSLKDSVDQLNELKQENNENIDVIDIPECESQGMSEGNSISQIELPLQVSYRKKVETKMVVQFKQWQVSEAQQQQQMNESRQMKQQKQMKQSQQIIRQNNILINEISH